MKLLAGAGALFLFAVGPVCAQVDNTYLEQGRNAVGQGDWVRAISIYTAAIAANPQDARAFYERGRVYEMNADDDKANRDKAIADFDQVIALDPKNEQAYFQRAGCHYEKGFFGNKDEQQKAIADYTQAVTLQPNDAEAWRMRGMAWGSMFDRPKQLVDDTQAIKVDPRDANAYNDRAVTYAQLHQPDKALADYTAALEIKPDAGTYENRATLYAKSRDFSHAVSDLNSAIGLESHDATTLVELADILATCPDAKIRDGKWAVSLATKACELTRWRDALDIQSLAAACAEAGDFASAVKWQQKYIAQSGIGPNDKSAANRLALYQAHQPYHDDGSAWTGG